VCSKKVAESLMGSQESVKMSLCPRYNLSVMLVFKFQILPRVEGFGCIHFHMVLQGWQRVKN